MSFYTSLNGLKNAQTDLGVIAHNIANVETNGFKKSRTEFADIVAGSAYSNPRLIQGVGATVESITQNFAVGPIEQTGSALDIAITGDGFFTTRGGATGETYFTRNGSFGLDENGYITRRFEQPPAGLSGRCDGYADVDHRGRSPDSRRPMPPARASPGSRSAKTAMSSPPMPMVRLNSSARLRLPPSFRPPGLSRWVRRTGRRPAFPARPTYGNPGEGNIRRPAVRRA